MIVVPAAVTAAYGAVPWEPWCRLTFTAPDGSRLATIAVEAGDVSSSDASWPRTRLGLSLPTSITPDLTAPPVSVFGGTVTVEQGVTITGTRYTWTLGTFDVAETDIARPEGTIRVGATSGEARVNEDRRATYAVTAVGALSSTVIRDLVRVTLPGVPVRVALTTDRVTDTALPLDGDIWPVIEQLADLTGAEVWFDSTGTLVIRDVPVVKGTPDLILKAGPGGTLTAYRSTRGWAPNRVAVVYTEQPAPGVAAPATTPRTRVGLWEQTTGAAAVSGPYGRHTRREDVSVDYGQLPSQAAAHAAAAAIAARSLPGARTVELRAVPAPWLEPGDTVRVELLGGLVETHVVSSVSFPVSMLDPMTVLTRVTT